MNTGIGEIITKLREESGFTQGQLCEGICSVSELAKMEWNQLVPGHFQLDRLFARMGKTTERLEYVLPKDIYELYELQYLIQTSICQLDFEEAERLLQEYERRKQASMLLHRQFIEQERAQMAWMRGEDATNVSELLNRAIRRTMKLEGVIESGNALSAEEMKLLLFRWEVSRETEQERPIKELSSILNYIDKHDFDREEKVRVYPYAVLLLIEEKDIEKEYDTIAYLLHTSLEMLREEGKILYMPEILEKYAELLKYGKKNKEYVKEILRQRRSLLELEEEFGIHLGQYRLFHHLNRAFELDYEIIRQERKALGLAQAELSDEICEPESLSRIERGKRSPSNKNMKALLKKMNRERQRINPIITTEKYEAILLEKEIAKNIQRSEYKKADELLEKLESMLDMNQIENVQYIAQEKIRKAFRGKNIDYEEGVEKLYKILELTLCKEKDIFAYRLTAIESNILNQIACQYGRHQENQIAISIWKKIIQNYNASKVHPIFRIRDWELMTGNLAGTMEEEKALDEAIEICKKRLGMALSIGKGNTIGRTVAIIACALERKRDDMCISRFRQALDLLKLMRVEYRYKCIREHIEQHKLWQKVERD